MPCMTFLHCVLCLALSCLYLTICLDAMISLSSMCDTAMYPPLSRSASMCASTLTVFFFEVAMAFVWAGFESITSHPKSSLMNLNTSYQTDDDSMTHLASLGMQANPLRMDTAVFLIFLLYRTFPLKSWTSTCSVFLCRSIPTYADGLRLVLVCFPGLVFEPDVSFMALLRFCKRWDGKTSWNTSWQVLPVPQVEGIGIQQQKQGCLCIVDRLDVWR